MVSRDFQALAARRAARALLLADRYPPSREALLFYTQIVRLQGRLAGSLALTVASDGGPALDSLLPGRLPLIELVEEAGTEKLREQARGFGESTCRDALRGYYTGEDTASSRSFLARVLLQPAMFVWTASAPDAPEIRVMKPAVGGNPPPRQPHGLKGESPAPGASRATEPAVFSRRPPEEGSPRPAAMCPRCGHAPQAGCLRPQGDGSALTLVCSLCLREWPFTRLRCPACGDWDHHNIAFYSTPEFPHLEVQACESCHGYLHVVDLSKENQAIADVDEMAALPLDLWAIENGYRKVQPNLAGI